MLLATALWGGVTTTTAAAAAVGTTATRTSTAAAASLDLCQRTIFRGLLGSSAAAAATRNGIIGFDNTNIAITATAFTVTASAAAATIRSATILAANGTNSSSLATSAAFLLWCEKSVSGIGGCGATAAALTFPLDRFGIHEA